MSRVIQFTLLVLTIIITTGFPTPDLGEFNGSWLEQVNEQVFYDGGDGLTPQTAMEISTPEQLALLAKSVREGNTYENQYLVLTQDIDLARYRWEPIGSAVHCRDDGTVTGTVFHGTFDGQGHMITNMSVAQINIDEKRPEICFALFAGNDGIIKNLKLSGANVISDQKSKLTNIAIMVGVNGGEISNCHVQGKVYGHYTTGGFAATNNGEIKNCSVSVQLTCDGKSVENKAGAFVGYVAFSTIQDCYATGEIVAKSKMKAGSFAGRTTSPSTVENSYSVIDIEGKYPVGNFTGEKSIGTFLNCYYNKDVSKKQSLVEHVKGLTTSEMKSSGFVELLNAGRSVPQWEMDSTNSNDGYPVLR